MAEYQLPLISGVISLPMIPCKSTPINIVIAETTISTITVGVRDSNDLATELGTCGGIEILKPLFWVKRYTSTAKKATIMPTKHTC